MLAAFFSSLGIYSYLHADDNVVAEKKTVRAAAIQFVSRWANPAENRKQLEPLIREAAHGGAKIVVLPEAAISAYLSHDIRLTWQIDNRPLSQGLQGRSPKDVAETVPGESTQAFGRLAKELGIYLTVPLVEVVPAEEKYYNTLVMMGPDGEIALHYRKLNPWPWAERGWATPGDRGIQMLDTPYGRLGLLICYDINFEPPKLKEKKVDHLLYSIAWVDDPGSEWFSKSLPEIARANPLNIIGANWSIPDMPGWHGYGQSEIIANDGKILARVKNDLGNEIIYADLPITAASDGDSAKTTLRRLPLKVYRDRMQGAWLGQMAGVGWGAPTEFHFAGEIIPEDKMPPWRLEMINQHGNDDCYVEMTFLGTLERYGLDVSIRQAGIDFANSGYPLWHANKAGRENLRAGIAPPDSGHPRFNAHADDIDYQIESDFAGIISPGMPQRAIALGETFGRLMNYGDGLYAGQFVAAMYCEAFFQDEPTAIIKEALRAIPAESQYAEMVRDLLRWHAENPDDWQQTWRLVEEKYHRDPRNTHGLCSKPGGAKDYSIDAKLNGAYILMGLLYGRRDPDKTIVISCRCGQDSDCNPSNAAGVLFTTFGASRVPGRFTEKLDRRARFSHTPYAWADVLAVCEKLARESVLNSG